MVRNKIKYFGISLIFVSIFVVSMSILSAADVGDTIHLNIQVTDPSTGEIDPGTYNFAFNITTDSACTSVVYSNLTSLTTDNRGIVSYYLENVNIDFTQQYYLCYYRDGTLVNNSLISRSPYSFTTKNATVGGLIVDSNLDLGSYNITASYLGIGIVNASTDVCLENGICLSNVNGSLGNYVPYTGANQNVVLGNNNFSVNTNTLFVNSNSGRVGIGISTPGVTLDVSGIISSSSDILADNSVQATNYMRTPVITPSVSGGGVNFTDYSQGSYALFINSTSGMVNASGDFCLSDGTCLGNMGPGDGNVSGAGATNYLAKWSSGNLTSSIIYDDGSSVGIGTASPQNELSVSGTANISGGLYVGETPGTGTLQEVEIAFDQNDATILRILNEYGGSGSYAGFNILSNDARLLGQVYSSSYSGSNYGHSMANWAEVVGVDFLGSINGIVFGTESNAPVTFAVNNGEVARFDTDGNLGINTTTPQNTLNVIGDGNFTGSLYSQGINLTALNTSGLIKDWNASGYIKDWNASGLIINWSLESAIESDPFWVANYSNFLTTQTNANNWVSNWTAYNDTWTTTDAEIWAVAGNGTLMFASDWNATNTSYVPYTGATSNLVLGNNNLSVGGTDFFVDNNNGRVGVGTSTPQNALNVIGTVNVTENLTLSKGGNIYNNGTEVIIEY